MLSAVWTATIIPDKSILEDLIKVLDNNYVKEYKAAPNELIPRRSVFLYAAEAIYKITDGKIGSNLVGTNEENLYKEKDSLIKQWRNIYDETLKQDYEPSELILPSTPVEPNESVEKTPDDKIEP